MIPDREKLTFAGGVLTGIGITVTLILLASMIWGCSLSFGQIPYSGPDLKKPYVRWFLFIDNSRKYERPDNDTDRRISGVLWTHNPTNHAQRVTVTCRAWEATPTRELCLLPRHTLQTQLYAFERDRLDPDLCQVVHSQEGCQ